LIDFFDEVALAEVLRTLDARLTSVCPVNHEADSLEQIRILTDALGNDCAWVVVKNETHSDAFKRRPRTVLLHPRRAEPTLCMIAKEE
jgi:hypothetical protein